jgi:hypothetical protein
MARKSHYLSSNERLVRVIACVLTTFLPSNLVWPPCALLLDTLFSEASTYL